MSTYRALFASCLIVAWSSCAATRQTVSDAGAVDAGSACGASGQACCPGGACSAGLVCDSSLVCDACGGQGEKCCSGTACNAGLTCDSSSVCDVCGGVAQACCSGTACNAGLTCVAGQFCGSGGGADGGAGDGGTLDGGTPDGGSADGGSGSDAGPLCAGAAPTRGCGSCGSQSRTCDTTAGSWTGGWSTCVDGAACMPGQLCEGDAGTLSCVDDTRGPFCQPCNITPGAASGSCPATGTTPSANFCLIDSASPFGSEFCGVDCSQAGQTCPVGFTCDDVLVPTDTTCGQGVGTCPLRTPPECTTTADCNGHGTCDTTTSRCRCAADTDCPAGTCDVSSGECSGFCEYPQEADVEGFCTCVYDTDCPANQCGSNGICSQTLAPCNPANSNSCAPVFCKTSVNQTTMNTDGFCFVGRNCEPSPGVTCAEVLAE